MKVVAFNGSPRRTGNTNRALEIALEELRNEGIGTELVQMGSEDFAPCQACYACQANKNRRCKIKTDKVNEWVEKIAAADGVIIGSPVYFGSMNGQTKAFIDRVGLVGRVNGDLFARKVGAAVAVNRRAGSLATFHEINDFFLIGHMVVIGSSYWNVINAHKPGDTDADTEGQEIMRNLGKNMAWVLKKLNG
ncbi:flavodoxin family protein [Methanomassiliicoccus luminyensis]|jgi:multimeric flavodoxin WrbA|uniref:flavodoxin family protein n=1 Tax=Methanomassiliicoccus luminyensis TaxID=1080712 RepID=UPI0003638103|nr:flavodoxin family protein [Methanomassiliicoccus luminyensis]